MSMTKEWLMDSAERDADLLAAEIERLETENAELRAQLRRLCTFEEKRTGATSSVDQALYLAAHRFLSSATTCGAAQRRSSASIMSEIPLPSNVSEGDDAMQNVALEVYFAAHRFGVIAGAGARMRKPPQVEMDHNARQSYGPHATVKEWAPPGGLVLARSVVTHDSSEYWLRRDLADDARAALLAEAGDSERIIAEVAGWIRRTDEAGAERTGMTVDAFRAKRLRDGMAWDKYRAKQRAGS